MQSDSTEDSKGRREAMEMGDGGGEAHVRRASVQADEIGWGSVEKEAEPAREAPQPSWAALVPPV